MACAFVHALMISEYDAGAVLTQPATVLPVVLTVSGSQKPWLQAPPLHVVELVHAVQPAGVPLAPGILLR